MYWVLARDLLQRRGKHLQRVCSGDFFESRQWKLHPLRDRNLFWSTRVGVQSLSSGALHFKRGARGVHVVRGGEIFPGSGVPVLHVLTRIILFGRTISVPDLSGWQVFSSGGVCVHRMSAWRILNGRSIEWMPAM